MNTEAPLTPDATSSDSQTHDAHTSSAPEPTAGGEQARAPRPLGVLVGFDGSPNATSALRWAAREAHFRGLPLTVMSSFTIPPAVSGYLESFPDAGGQTLARQATEKTLNTAREQLAGHAGEVTYRLEHGDAAGLMVHLSGSAELCVVGSRGRGGFTGRILGSVAAALPGHAHSPTVVVPHTDESSVGEGSEAISTADTRPVVVGIDGSPHSRRASVQAARTAISHGTRLQLVMALPPLTTAAMWYPELAAREQAMVQTRVDDLNRDLDVEVGWIQAQFPELSVTGSVEEGFPVNVMQEMGSKAQLTVVGTRGHGGMRSALLGSVSRELLHHATAPVMVVPAHD
ncbi:MULTISPECIES: universal stress protein [unclassified Nesterenkonia]|uniref:universal stress protein n=1 Tax=unclassified Nesterenkonia TaxID=2629769 RepID=UPI001F4C66B4|nr:MULTISPECIES: universal stress protein [unclassified Nesterenkonia]MCH8560284.1 universal stress protein [Nesterenkonia sp. DZ6]MCH8563712.1 universal stress protein [Nesterenkonia sp. YGD6]MCH8571751.1 universal stress protein [Nesterenkonia sp. AY15]